MKNMAGNWLGTEHAAPVCSEFDAFESLTQLDQTLIGLEIKVVFDWNVRIYGLAVLLSEN
jgi:hypothetical protein